MKQKKTHQETEKKPIFRISADPAHGLTSQQAQERQSAGYANTPVQSPSKTTKQIVQGHIFTYFNLIFFVLGLLILLVRSYRDLTFLGIIAINALTGIVQELKAKKELDSLRIVSAPKCRVVRDGQVLEIPVEHAVLDDIALFSAGNQIYADAVIAEGEVLVNESLVTGEADEIRKQAGDTLLSGSFVVSGKCHARLDAVGADSYVSKLSLEAKRGGKTQKSEMMRSLDRLVKVIGVIIIPVGIGLFYQQHVNLGYGIRDSVVSTVAALVGMIPEGLYLLTTAALAVSVVRLARSRVLVHEMKCIETLARVDTLCVDKTGTITQEKMSITQMVPLADDITEDGLEVLLASYVQGMEADNETMKAIKSKMSEKYRGRVMRETVKTLPFSSARKFGGVSFADGESFLLGAPEFVLGTGYAEYQSKISEYASLGCRVLLLARYDRELTDSIYETGVQPVGLVVLQNKIRENAPETFRYFAEQEVAVKVISGDNPETVSVIAQQAGIPNADTYVDAMTLDTPEKLAQAAGTYTVFGRVTPQQKQDLVRAMKQDGHTVAMTGDGVNDVLALKEADCSIAMASGSDVAAKVSQLVLLSSDFGAMPAVVAEGRRVINNIERSASLFLVKNIFSLFLALITISATLPYPLAPSQVSLVSGLCIGFPAFVLALEPNRLKIRGHFLPNVLYRALPAGLTDVTMVLCAIAFSLFFDITADELSTISAILMSFVGIIVVYRVCKPFNLLRKVLFVAVTGSVLFCILFMPQFFSLTPLSNGAFFILVMFLLATIPVIWAYENVLRILKEKALALGNVFRRPKTKKS